MRPEADAPAHCQPIASPADPRRIERVFACCFGAEWRTRLEGGGAEPLYVASPDPESRPHRIVYREDYFSSALHEVAHWCLAGAARRRLDDYGYWYQPDGRSPAQQRAFEAVEARPQALEWIFTDACRVEFHLSADNLDGGSGPSDDFAAAVERERQRFLREGLPPRAERFLRALALEWSAPPAVLERAAPPGLLERAAPSAERVA